MKRGIILMIALFSAVIISCSVNSGKAGSEEMVAIKACNNMYVTVPADTCGLKLIARSKDVGDWERFQLIYGADKSVNIKANTNLFVCSNFAAGDYLFADKKNASDWEKFTIEDLGNNLIAIKASNGKYISADIGMGGVLIAKGEKIGDWEKFTLVKQ